jgi:undecaprenyl-phosphate 4-deoxy-4-formamido-L-arabinose transferase
MISLSVVIPVYNGALSIRQLTEELQSVLPGLAESWEIIFVEDDGKDDSWTVLKVIVRDFPNVRAFKHMRNFGQHNALLVGIRAAQYDVIVTMDDDLQHPPIEVHKLIEKLAEGYDVVYGTPVKERHGLLRDLASQITKIALQNAMGVNVARNVSAFRIFRTSLRRAFEHYDNPVVNLDVLLTWGTTRFAAITIPHAPRRFGTSNYTVQKLINHAVNMITGFSTLPLQIASLLGFALTIFGFLILIYVFVRLLVEPSVPGFPFLASIIAVFSGAQLLALGVIGEYLARMHVRIMGRPSSVVREAIGSTDAQSDPVEMKSS